jgi:hypothetical protein
MKNNGISVLKNFDQFGQKLSLKIAGENSSKSSIGGVCTIATYIIVLIVIIVEIVAVFTNSSPTLSEFTINNKIGQLGNTSLLEYNYDLSY